MSLSDDQIRRLARLARLAIRPEESDEILEGLRAVVGDEDEGLSGRL